MTKPQQLADVRSLINDVLQEHASLCPVHDAGLATIGPCACGNPRQALVELAAALNAAMDLHEPMGWYGECACTGNEPEHEASLMLINDDYWTCEQGRIYPDRCRECTPDYPDGNDVIWPCPTVQAIRSALTRQEVPHA